MTEIQSYQNAVPSFRELLPTIVGFPLFFLIGFAGIVVGTNEYFASHISQGLLCIGIVVCTFFGGLILRSLKIWRVANELSVNGLVTQGHIIDLKEDNARYYVVYAFDLNSFDPDAREFAAQQVISYSIYTQLQVGNTVRVRFLPENPKLSRMETPFWRWEY